METTRRTFLTGAAVMSMPVAVVAAPSVPDPLVDAIQAYRAGLAEFNRLAALDENADRWEALADETYSPCLAILTRWTEPATSSESAAEALRLALTDDGGVYGCAAADSMARAALAYLEGAAA